MRNLYLARGDRTYSLYKLGSSKTGFTKRHGLSFRGWGNTFCPALFEKFTETNIEVVPGTLYRVKSVKIELEEMQDRHD